MREVFLRCWSHFAEHTGIWKRFSWLEAYETWILAVVFGLALVVGFWVFRLYFSVIFFYLYITACVFLLPRVMSWQNTVALMSVTGVIFSVLLYRNQRVGSLVLSGAIGGMIGMMIFPEGILAGVFALVAMLLTFLFPVHGICAFMALFGGLGFCDLLYLPVYAGLLVAVPFFFLQLAEAKEQILFPKKYPDRVRYWLEKRKETA